MGIIYNLPADTDWLDERGQYRGTFTDTVRVDWQLPWADVCFLSPLGASIAVVCLVSRGDVVATFKRRVRFTDLVSLGEPLPWEDIVAEMPVNLRHHLIARRPRSNTVPPRTWSALVDVVKRLRPQVAADIDRIIRLARDPTPVYRGRKAEILALEKDALGLALMAADMDRSALLTWSDTEQPMSFVSGLSVSHPIEEHLIDYDASVFGSWDLVDHTPGVHVFGEEGKRLEVVNVNRTDVEHALGVDLVYVNQTYGSYVLVQYKRMKKESGRNVYRPDKSLPGELTRMRSLPISYGPGEPSTYRLHPGSSYLKLCPETDFRPRDSELIRGMYLPLDFWDSLIASEALLGPKRGLAVTFENAGRHLSSSLFAALIRDGWVGSRVESTELLKRVVDELLDARHSVTLAEYRESRSRASSR